MPTNVGGVKGFVGDYSISQAGPGETACKIWEHARRRGIKTAAKIQINNTWECSAVPYLPVPDLAEAFVEKEKHSNFADLDRVALAAYCHFRSTYLQIKFVRLRDCRTANWQQEITEVLKEEIEVAKTLEKLVREDSRIGFEATNQYCYTVNNLREKVLNCKYILKQIKGKLQKAAK